MNRLSAMTGVKRQGRRATAKKRLKGESRGLSGRIRVPLTALVLMLVALLIGSATWALRNWLLSPTTLPIREVNVRGELTHVPPARVRAAVNPFLHAGFFGLNLRGISAALEVLPWVAHVDVRRVWPDALDIRIEQQHPVASWNGDALLNARGTVFRPSRDSFPKGLPTLSGPSGKELDLMKRYETVNGLFGKAGLRVIGVREDARRAFSLRLNNGIEIVIGRDWDMKRMARMIAVYRHVLVGKTADIARIDLRYTNGFAVAWKTSAAQAAAASGRH